MSKIKVCIVGCGRIASLNVLGYLNNPDAELYALSDVSEENARKFAEEHHIVPKKIYTDFNDVCNDPEINLIDILVPHHLHCDMVVRACNAKKHVSIQKPMALSLVECDKMIAAAKENGVKLKVYENFVFYPPYVKAKELMDAGEIGEPLTIRIKMVAGQRGQSWKIDPKTWAWRMQEETCGGGPLVFDDGNHKFSIARYFMGDPEEVFAFIDQTPLKGATFTKSDGSVIQFYEDAPAIISWKCKDSKRYGVFDITFAEDLKIDTKYYACDERVEITGSKGVIWINHCTGNMQKEPAVILYRDNETVSYQAIKDDWSESFIASTKDFIEAIVKDKPAWPSGEEGRENVKFSLAAIRSSCEKRRVTIDEMEQY